MRLVELVDASEAIGATRKRGEKVAHLAQLLQVLEGRETEIGARFLAGELRQGKIGIGYATITKTRDLPPAPEPRLTLTDIDEALVAYAQAAGAGSGQRRAQILGDLLRRATAREQGFLRKLLVGELRQGALEGLLVEGAAKAAKLPAGDIRRARMLSGDVGAVVIAALSEGALGLERFRLTLFTPVHPMLAGTAETVEDTLEKLGEAVFEVKLDGARIQAHKDGDEVRVYTRRLNEVTAAVPEVVEAVRALPARRLILDGEAIALRGDSSPHPFQVTMRRFGRRLDIERRQRPQSRGHRCLWARHAPL